MFSASLISDLIDAIAPLYNEWGYLIVFLGVLAENTAVLGLLLPGGTLALLGAFYAREGTLALPLVIFFAWIGTVVGYSTDYLIGRYLLGRATPKVTASRLGRRFHLAGRLRQAQRLLTRHGGKAILLSHVVGHVRSFVALTAGMTHMRYRRFLAFELVAALLWNTGFCLLGYIAGAQRERLQMFIERGGWVLLGLAVAAYLIWRYAWPQVQRRRLALVGERNRQR
jgi:membrane protein DedA with SNARE-associated domain